MALFKHHLPTRDPATGDELTTTEALSWIAQSIIRRWSFVGTFCVVTAIVWAFGSPVALGWWNYSASALAIVVESVVGIGVFSMSKRDAVILREIHQMDKELQQQGDEIAALAKKQDELSEAIFDQLQRME